MSASFCKCNSGYYWDSIESECVPDCTEMNCKDGKCLAHNLCKCNENYYWNSKLRQCLPVCKNGCTNGQCTSPNICTCDKNFELDLNNKSVCNPICEPKCKFYEICSITSMCDCNLTNSSTSCECPNSCILNTNIKCPEKISCVTHSEIEHFNYTTCTCEFGYRLEKINDCYQCQTMCRSLYDDTDYINTTLPEQCENGVCISPGVCECESGYYLNETISKHICSRLDCDENCISAKLR